MGKLDGRTALVTGASRGIGEQCARALNAEGARVALAARSVSDMEAIAGDLNDAVVIEADMLTNGAGASLAAKAIDAMGGVDIVVNNAGISDRQGDEHQVLQVNYIAPMELTAALAPQVGERSLADGAAASSTPLSMISHTR